LRSGESTWQQFRADVMEKVRSERRVTPKSWNRC
jgi:hypothetical protein